MDFSIEFIQRIIAEHEQIIGSLAWEEAGKVDGLTIDVVNKKIVSISSRPEVAMSALIARYERLFGRTAIEIAREVTKRNSDSRLIFYVYDEKTDREIEQICRKYGLTLLTQTDQINDWIFYFVDGFILEVTQPTEVLQNLLTYAIRSKKPTLCLYRKNQPPRNLLQVIRHYKNHHPLKTFSYTPNSLATCVQKFIQTNDVTSEFHENISRIKFTLRLSARMEKYIRWKAKNLNISKADFVRQLIHETYDKDQSYISRTLKSRKSLNIK